jgi:FG-GAP-like repeat
MHAAQISKNPKPLLDAGRPDSFGVEGGFSMPADVIGFGGAGVWVALSNGDGTFQPMQLVINNFGYSAGSWRVDRHPRVLADVTGDGRADIVAFGDAGVYIALSNGDGTFTEVGRVIDNFGYRAGGWRVDMHPRVLADVTGAGRADIVGFGGAGVYVALSNGDGTFTEVGRVIDDFAYNGGWRVDVPGRPMQPGGWAVDRHPRVLADITGERGADIVGFGNDGVWVALSNGDGTFQPAYRAIGNNFGAIAGGWEGLPRLLADVTGDGRADIVAISAGETHVLLSNGDGSFQDRYYVEPNLHWYSLEEENPVVLADITGDRRPDIVMIDYLGVASALNNGDGSFQRHRLVTRAFASRHYYPDTQRFVGDWRWGWHPRYVADITGDGRADIVGFGNDGVWVALSNGDGTFQPAYRAIGNFGADHSAGGWSADRYPRTVANLTGRR